jgi:hypothetical protein
MRCWFNKHRNCWENELVPSQFWGAGGGGADVPVPAPAFGGTGWDDVAFGAVTVFFFGTVVVGVTTKLLSSEVVLTGAVDKLDDAAGASDEGGGAVATSRLV